MSNRLIISLPVKPYAKMSVGRMTTPILGESLAKSFDGNFVMSINDLSSYDTRESSSFIELLNHYNINPNSFWIDREHIQELIEKVYLLIEKGFIREEEKELLRCECGKTEIAKDNISTINFKDSLFEIRDGKYYCKFCHSECIISKEVALVFNSRLVDKNGMLFYPYFMNKDKKTFDNTVGNNDIVISRKRDTGIIIEYNSHIYNLDIDFLWEVFLSLFSDEEKIVMCGNHQMYQLYMVGMLEKCFNKNSNTVCLATPYLESSSDEAKLENRALSLKVYSLLVMRWAKKENTFDPALLNYINTMNVEKKQMLYEILIEGVECTHDIGSDLQLVLGRKYNFQVANTELKRRRRNV